MSNRNEQYRFAENPGISIERSRFNISQNHKTTLNAGDLIPFYLEMDVLPGDTFNIKTSSVVRMSTPIFPVMDNCYMDTYFFFIPNRILWDHWKDFMGENRDGAWAQETEYQIPQYTSPAGGVAKGSVEDYMGIPTGIANLAYNKIPLRGYQLIWNEWFRDQNLTAPIAIDTGDSDSIADAGGMQVLKAYKIHDYFTSALPAPQKGAAVQLPLGTSAPILTNETQINTNAGSALLWKNTTGAAIIPATGTSDNIIIAGGNGFTAIDTGGVSGSPDQGILPANLYADLTSATAATISALRLAVQTQRILERDARGGTRYTEIIKNHFGVHSPDGRQQRPEYLGGSKTPISITQVLQTSGTTETSPQGNTAAFSLTADSGNQFAKSFTEHGIIIGVAVIRQEHTYQQGLERGWSRRRRLDYYFPTLAHLSEQPILNKEIYAQGTDEDNEVFGYQERWAEYRYKPNRTSGAMRSTYATPLDSWHYGDDYGSLPVLSTEFLQETKDYIDRTLAIKSTVEDQFIADILVDIVAVRPMPVYSIPGLLDHF